MTRGRQKQPLHVSVPVAFQMLLSDMFKAITVFIAADMQPDSAIENTGFTWDLVQHDYVYFSYIYNVQIRVS